MDDSLFDTLEDMGAEVDDSLDRMMGDEEMYLHYLGELKNDQSILKLRAALGAKDYSAAEKAVHTLKGVALNLGLLPLADVCIEMMMDFREGKNAEGAAMLGEVDAELKRWVDAIATV